MTDPTDHDLWLCLAMVLAFAAVSGCLGWWAGRAWRVVGQAILVVGLMLATVAYLAWGRDTSWWTAVLPVSGVVVLSNPTPWLASAMAGLCVAQRGLPRWRRGVVSALILGAGCYVPASLLVVEPPPTVPTWVDGVALQTTPATCSPAAAATLLKAHGIETTERQMAELFLTNAKGTPLLGLYRGLSKMTAGHGLRPNLTTVSLDELQRRPELLPAVVSVRLTTEVDAREPRYRQDWGWILGVRHSVTFLSFDGPDHVWVGDPGVGRERWRLTHTRDLWVGDVLSLEPVNP